MLRGHFGSVELIRAIFNPPFRRNLSGASIRYAENRDNKKADNVFSWLKDIFRSDDGIQEVRKVSINRGPVTVLDYPETNEGSLINFEYDRVDDQGSIKNRTNFYDTKNNYIDYEKSQRFPHRYLLALSEKIDTSIRTIMGCTPRNTKPPIREPNMPEKQEKKDEKKEKKKKKPVIRMEGGLTDTNQNDPTLKAEGTLHDNLDVNFRHQWGVRLPEEVEKRHNMELQQSVGSSCQVPVYDMENLQLTMSSSKDSESIDAKTEGHMGKKEAAPLSDVKQVAKDSKGSKKVLNVSPGMMTEGGVVDEDYNIPPGTNVDAEVTAWKELVLRSKIRLDPSKEQFVADDERRDEMLSIRPEPPRPKLDVQAVPTSNDETMNEEEDETEFSSDDRTSFKPDTGRIGSPADVQKLDSKKLHTGSTRFTRKGSSRILDTIDNSVGFVASQRALDFSTSTDSGWDRTDQSTATETEQVPSTGEVKSENRLDQRSSDMEVAENSSNNQGVNVEGRQETLANFEQQRQAEMDQDFRDSLNSIGDREMDMEMSMNSLHDEEQNMREDRRISIDRQDQRHAEREGQLRSLSDDFQASFDYANTPYEDDFYPTYESMSLEPAPEKSTTKKSKEPQQSTAASSDVQNDEGFVNPDEMEYREEEYTSDGNYIRVPGDPYPYSPEHFNKWSHKETVKPQAELAEIQPSVRKLHNDAHASTLGGVQEIQDMKENENRQNESSTKIIHPDDGVKIADGSESTKTKDDSATHVETIQPDIDRPNFGVNKNMARRYIVDAPSSLIQRPKVASNENQREGYPLEDIHVLRNEQLSSVSKDEIEKIYESKNYAYLRAEEMKNFQLNLKSKSRTSEQETSAEENNE